MHDPMTVAHEIKYPLFKYKPWPKKARRDPNSFRLKRAWEEMPESQRASRDWHWPEGYRETFITIWHIDPERDGSDDSCGRSYIKLTPQQREVLRNAAWSEGQHPHFLCCAGKEWEGTFTEAESLHRGLAMLVCRVLRLRIPYADICAYATEAVHMRDCGKYGGAFCFLPGYHTNSDKDSKDERQNHFHGILCGVARVLITGRRPWWKHPRWHFWHWKFQCHPLGAFKRWAFSKCCKCGKQFSWNASVCTNNWNSRGPRWFRGEPDIYHSGCGDSGPVQENAEQQNVKG